MNIDPSLAYYKHKGSGLEFAAEGAFNYEDELNTYFKDPSLERLEFGFEVTKETHVEYYMYDHDNHLYFKREEDIEEFFKLTNGKFDASIVVTPERYWAMLEDKRSARSDGTY